MRRRRWTMPDGATKSVDLDRKIQLKIQKQQEILAAEWKKYIEDLNTMYTDTTCYESEMRYPTDAKLLWEGIEKSYGTMCGLSSGLGVRRPRTKYLDVRKANLSYRKRRRHTKGQTRKITRRLLDLLGKILGEIRNLRQSHLFSSLGHPNNCHCRHIEYSSLKRIIQ